MTTSRTLALTEKLLGRASVTPEDKGCQDQLIALLESPTEAVWALGAAAAATPYLFYERRPLWDRLAKRILKGDGGAIAARALARGLAREEAGVIQGYRAQIDPSRLGYPITVFAMMICGLPVAAFATSNAARTASVPDDRPIACG